MFDNCSLTFKYANGQHYEYSLCYSNGHLGSQEMILGTKGTMLLEQRGAVSWMEPVRGARPAARTTSGQTREIITGASRRAARRSPTYTMGEPIGEFLVDWYEPEMHDFFRNIRDNKKPLCDVEVARNAAVSMYMGVRAMVTGEPVYWDQTWNTV